MWPLYPAYLGYLAGVGSAAGDAERSDGLVSPRAGRWPVVRQALAFILGFSLVFVALGASASALGQLLLAYQEPFRKVGGLVIIAFGLMLAGLLPSWVLGREARWTGRPAAPSPMGAALMGIAFAFGWTPCVGPILAAILVLTSLGGSVGQGTLALAVYSLGLAVPFLLMALFLERLRPAWSRVGRALPWIQRASGAALVVLGALVFSGSFASIARWLYGAF